MTKKYLYPSKFWNWVGWDYLKWVTGAVILAGILWVIWCHNTNQKPVENLPAWAEAAVNALDR